MSATPDPWRAALAHVDELMDLRSAERERILGELEARDPELHRRVRVLLAAHEEASDSGFLEIPESLRQVPPAELQAGARLGPYRLVREIGSGGMGKVWLARRDDGQYDGEVAIKTLHAHLTTSGLRERFRREAMLLARLQHSNIARLLDAGSTDGANYLVLELVHGEPIEAWCDGRNLDIGARLQLFAQVCAAVAHAHANLVVHRDIKPGNILVAAGGIKLLDFGIAKLLDSDPGLPGGTASELTQLMGRALTPDYAAPEQIRGEGVTTATDVYSLGALLYVLLCGARPFSGHGRSPVEVEHAALHDDPPALTRAARLGAEPVAAARAVTAARLQQALSGDLQHIVSRAMRKRPGDRYESVLALAEDVRRYLAREPVAARSGSWSYRAGRWISRHRVAVALSAALALSALLGVAGVWWQAREAREQARIATREALRANAVSDFLLGVFNANSDAHPGGLQARQTTAEELLAIGGKQLLAAGEQDIEVLGELLGTLGMLNLKLEKFEEAEALFLRRISDLEQAYGSDDARLAAAWLDLGELKLFQQKYAETRALAGKARTALDSHGQHLTLDRGRAEHLLGYAAYFTASKLDDPVPTQHFTTEVDILGQLPASRQLVMGMIGLGKAQFSAGKHDAAVETLNRALSIAVGISGSDNMDTATVHQILGSVLTRMRRLNEAAPHQQRALEIVSRTYGKENGLSALLQMEVARLQMQQGRFLEAAHNFAEAIPVRERVYGEKDMWARLSRGGLGQALIGGGDFEMAGKALDAVARALEDGSDDPLRGVVLRERATLRLEQGRAAEARADADRGVELARAAAGPKSLPVAQVLTVRAEALTLLGKHEEARASLAEATEILAGNSTPAARPVAIGIDLARMRAELSQRSFASAQASALAALEKIAADDLPESLWALQDSALRRLAEAQRGAGEHAAACESLEAAIKLRADRALPKDPRLLDSRRQLARCASSAAGS